MFKYMLIAALVGCVYAVSEEAHAQTEKEVTNVRADGFDYIVATSNHILSQASGDVHGNIHGQFEWVSPEGEHINVKYVADENGYQPISDVLPTPPPVPIEILKSLEYIRAHPYVEPDHKH